MFSNLNDDYKILSDLLTTSPEVDAKKLQNAINQLILLRMDYTEMACLKTIILFRPGKNDSFPRKNFLTLFSSIIH